MSVCMHMHSGSVCVGADVESRAAVRLLTGSVSTVSHRQRDGETCPVRHGSSLSPRMEFLGIPGPIDCYQSQRPSARGLCSDQASHTVLDIDESLSICSPCEIIHLFILRFQSTRGGLNVCERVISLSVVYCFETGRNNYQDRTRGIHPAHGE